MRRSKWIAALALICPGGGVLASPGQDKTVLAAETAASDFEYRVLDDGTVEISNYKGAGGDIVIPEEIGGRRVTGVGWNAFFGEILVTGIRLPEGLTSIGSNAFAGCSRLEGEFFIPKSVTEIVRNAFSGCVELTSFIVAEENQNYASENGILYNKEKTALLRCPSGKKGEVNLSSDVTKIEAYAFSGCSGLTGELQIPSGITEIGECAFEGCAELTSFFVADENQNYASENEMLYNKKKTTLICCPSGKKGEVNLSTDVTKIEARAFLGCSDLTGELHIPESVTEIGDAAFQWCGGLTGELLIPAGIQRIELGAFSGCSGLTKIHLPEGLAQIGIAAFAQCSGLTGELKIPSSVTSVGESAFSGCGGLTKIHLPEGLAQIGIAAFGQCSGLTGELRIPSSVTSVGESAFSGCSGLTGELQIPSGMTRIGENVFSGCSGLTGVRLPEGLMYIDTNAFINCSGLKGELQLPSSTASIGEGAFARCSSLTSIIVGKNSKNFSSKGGILYNKDQTRLLICPGGKKGDINQYLEGVTEIGNAAFYGCGGLKGKLQIPSSVTVIGSRAFWECSGLTEISLPNCNIYYYAFANCAALETVRIPAGASWADDIFKRTSLKAVYYGGSKSQWLASGGGQLIDVDQSVVHFSVADSQGNQTAAKVRQVRLSAAALTIPKGMSRVLTVSTEPLNKASVTWASSNGKVASVSGGTVTAKKSGTAVITATASGGAKASCRITVAEVKLNATSAALKVGTSSTALKVESKFPKSDAVASWKSSNPKIVKVSGKGKITARGRKGSATITVTMKSGATASCKIKAQKASVRTKKLSIHIAKATLKKGKRMALSLARNPVTATDKVTWSSSRPNIATVTQKGKVTAKKKGTAKIVAKTKSGKKATCTISVK